MGQTHSLSSDDFNRLKEDGVEVMSFKGTLIATSEGLVPEAAIPTAPETTPQDDDDGDDDSGLLSVLGSSGGRPVTITFAGKEALLRESDGRYGYRTLLVVGWTQVLKLVWDHAQSAVKVEGRPTYSDYKNALAGGQNMFAILTVANSLELEVEIKNRIRAEAKRLSATGGGLTMPEFVYIGMFAGSTKPKPFQRKRANLSPSLPAGQLPALPTMRRWAIEAHAGSARPLPQGTSMRSEMALELVYSGENRFTYLYAEELPKPGATPLLSGGGRSHGGEVAADGGRRRSSSSSGAGASARRSGELVFAFGDVTAHGGVGGAAPVAMLYQDIVAWRIEDHCHLPGAEGADGNGLEVTVDDPCRSVSGDGPAAPVTMFYHFHKSQIQLVRATMAFFWNRSRAEHLLPPHAGSTHGRNPYSVLSLQGEQKAPDPPLGRTVIVDVDGVTVRPGQVLKSPRHPTLRRTSKGVKGQGGAVTPGGTAAARVATLMADRTTLRMNARVKPHWDAVVVHSGWLQKQGGSSAAKWLWRFCVLFSTAQGHFFAYYTDIPDVPLYSETGSHRERGMLDMARVAFIRPVSATKGTPPHSFDMVLLDREWTLCAESPKAMLLWMQVLARAAEADVAVQPDDETVFRVALAAAGASPGAAAASGGAVYTVAGEALVKVSCMGVAIQQLRGESAPTPRSTEGYGAGAGGPTGAVYGGGIVGTADGDLFYPYTDFYKWVLVDLRDGMQGLLLKSFKDDKFDEKSEHLLVNARAADIAAHVEYHIEKFMAYMHLRLETEWTGEEDIAGTNGSAAPPVEDLLLLDLDDPSDANGSAAPQSTGAPQGLWHLSSGFGGDSGSALDVHPTPKNAPWNPFESRPARQNSGSAGEEFDEEDDDNSTGPPSADGAPLSPGGSRRNSSGSAGCGSSGRLPRTFFQEDFGDNLLAAAATAGAAATPTAAAMEPLTPSAAARFPPTPTLPPLRWDNLASAAIPPSPAAAAFSPNLQASIFGAVAPPSPAEPAAPLDWLQDPFTAAEAAPTLPATPPPPGEVIHDGASVMISVISSRFAAGSGEILLHYRPLASTDRLSVAPAPGAADAVAIFWEVPPLAPAPVVAAGAPAGLQHTVRLQCRRPFAEKLELLVVLESGGQRREERVKLPWGLCAFVEPLRVAAPSFQQRWQALGAAVDRSAQAVFRPAAPGGSGQAAAAARVLAGALHLEEVAGADLSGATAALAGLLRTTSLAANGEPVSVGCLVVVEVDPRSGMLRVTARSANAVVSAAVAAAAQQAFGA